MKQSRFFCDLTKIWQPEFFSVILIHLFQKRFPQFITTALLYFVEKLRRSAETAALFSYMKLSQGFNV